MHTVNKTFLNILQVNTRDSYGGAANIAYSLHNEFKRHGHKSRMAVGVKTSLDETIFPVDNASSCNIWTRFFYKLGSTIYPHIHTSNCHKKLHKYLTYYIGQPRKYISYKLGHENFNFPASKKILKLNNEKPDIIHLHNLHGQYFDLKNLIDLSNNHSVVLTLHDTWLFTGHCANFIDCNRWTNGCGNCPDLTLLPPIERDATAFNLKKKSTIYNKSKLYLTSPSNWLMDKINKSILSPAVVESKVIHNGINESVFRTYDRLRARRELSLPLDKKIVLYVAKDFINNPYKGYDTFLSAINKLSEKIKDKSVIFLAIGNNSKSIMIGNILVKYVGYIDDQNIMARYYQASDVYLLPSKADNFPLAVLEALACGIPVVGTKVGGVSEQIVNDVNGYLVSNQDVEGIAYYINKIITSADLQGRLSDNCIKTFNYKYKLKYMVQQYIDWYHHILESSNNHS